ncbi:MAG: permease-like cell division protein FtsX [Candidatus Caenarcaniphilales bacterium]|nr:permease-like cell division protein FtsX [Candidatus Caenarcaniphilales bacterium]
MRTFRMLMRVVAESGLGLWRSGWLNLIIVSILMSTLTVFGIMLEFSVSLKKLANNVMGSETQFTIFLKDKVEPEGLIEKLRGFKEVMKIEVVPREKAWMQMNQILDLKLDDSLNNLPDALNVRVNHPKYAAYVINELHSSQSSDIDQIIYAPAAVQKLNMVKNLLILLGTFISILLGIATFVINFNTIELVIRARREELKLLSFMGVTNWFIKGPFVLQGIFYGLISALAAGFVLWTFDSFTRFQWHQLMSGQFGLLDVLWPNPHEFTIIILILGLVGVTFSSASSFWATERRLHV